MTSADTKRPEIARVSKRAYPDHYALEKGNPYFDPKSDPENPRLALDDR